MQPVPTFVVAFNRDLLFAPLGRLREGATEAVEAFRHAGGTVLVVSGSAKADAAQCRKLGIGADEVLEVGRARGVAQVEAKAKVLRDAGVYAYVSRNMVDPLAAQQAEALPIAIGRRAAAGVDYMFDHPDPVKLTTLADLPSWMAVESNAELVRSWGPGILIELSKAAPTLEEYFQQRVKDGTAPVVSNTSAAATPAAPESTTHGSSLTNRPAAPRASGEGPRAPGLPPK